MFGFFKVLFSVILSGGPIESDQWIKAIFFFFSIKIWITYSLFFSMLLQDQQSSSGECPISSLLLDFLWHSTP